MLVNAKAFKAMFVIIFLWPLQTFANKSNDLVNGAKNINTEINCAALDQPFINPNNLSAYLAEQPFILLGKAKFSVLFWDIYESALLTTDGQRPFDDTCQQSLFEIEYLRDISKKDLLDNTVSQWQHLSFKESEYAVFLPLLERIWLDINAGDRLSMLTQENKTLFYLNSKFIGEIDSATFAKTFLSIWIDEGTSEPKLRLKLLGDNA